MTEQQQEILTKHILDFALNWRHMIASPVAEIQAQGAKQVTIIADNIWNLVQGLGDGATLEVVAGTLQDETLPAGTLAAYLMKALVCAERGKFLSFTTTYKNDAEHRDLFGVQVGDHIFSVDYLHSLLNSGASPDAVDPAQALTLPQNAEVRAVRGRNKCVLYAFRKANIAGQEYQVTVQKKLHTVNDDPEHRQDPVTRLASDENAQVATIFCTERMKKERAARRETADMFARLCSVLVWLGETPKEHEKKDAQYVEKNGDGCRCLNAADVKRVALDGIALDWNVV